MSSPKNSHSWRNIWNLLIPHSQNRLNGLHLVEISLLWVGGEVLAIVLVVTHERDIDWMSS